MFLWKLEYSLNRFATVRVVQYDNRNQTKKRDESWEKRHVRSSSFCRCAIEKRNSRKIDYVWEEKQVQTGSTRLWDIKIGKWIELHRVSFCRPIRFRELQLISATLLLAVAFSGIRKILADENRFLLFFFRWEFWMMHFWVAAILLERYSESEKI